MDPWTIDRANQAIAAALAMQPGDAIGKSGAAALAWLVDHALAAERAAADLMLDAAGSGPGAAPCSGCGADLIAWPAGRRCSGCVEAEIKARTSDAGADLALWRGRFEGAREISAAAFNSAFEAGRLVGIGDASKLRAEREAAEALEAMKRPPGAEGLATPEGLEDQARDFAHRVVNVWDLAFFEAVYGEPAPPPLDTPAPPPLDTPELVFEAGAWIREALGPEGRAWLGVDDFERADLLRRLIVEVFEVDRGGGSDG